MSWCNHLLAGGLLGACLAFCSTRALAGDVPVQVETATPVSVIDKEHLLSLGIDTKALFLTTERQSHPIINSPTGNTLLDTNGVTDPFGTGIDTSLSFKFAKDTRWAQYLGKTKLEVGFQGFWSAQNSSFSSNATGVNMPHVIFTDSFMTGLGWGAVNDATIRSSSDLLSVRALLARRLHLFGPPECDCYDCDCYECNDDYGDCDEGDFYGGFGWSEFDDRFNVSSTTLGGINNDYGIGAFNDLFGGFVGVRQRVALLPKRLYLTGSVETGFYANDAVQHQNVYNSSAAPSAVGGGGSKVDFSFNAQASIGLEYKLTSNISLNAGYRMSLFTGLSTAAGNTSPAFNGSSASLSASPSGETVIFHGGYFGAHIRF